MCVLHGYSHTNGPIVCVGSMTSIQIVKPHEVPCTHTHPTPSTHTLYPLQHPPPPPPPPPPPLSPPLHPGHWQGGRTHRIMGCRTIQGDPEPSQALITHTHQCLGIHLCSIILGRSCAYMERHEWRRGGGGGAGGGGGCVVDGRTRARCGM